MVRKLTLRTLCIRVPRRRGRRGRDCLTGAGEADLGRAVSGVQCREGRGGGRLHCPGCPLQPRFESWVRHISAAPALDSLAVPSPPVEAAGRGSLESLQRSLCVGPRLGFCCSAWIPGDRMPCAFSLGSLPLPRAGPAVPGRRLGATKPQERLGGRWVMPDSAPPHVQRLPGSPPNIKRVGESAISARAGTGGGNHFNQAALSSALRNALSAQSPGTFRRLVGGPPTPPGGCSDLLPPGWAGGARLSKILPFPPQGHGASVCTEQ